MIVKGVSFRAITRMTGVSKNTVSKSLADAGQACLEFQDKTLRNLSCQRRTSEPFDADGNAPVYPLDERFQ
jgi:hypothetical protein